MPALMMTITDVGMDALVAAEAPGSDAILITALGLTATPFVQAPTLTAVPGQFKLLDVDSGEAVSETIIHTVAYDTSDDVYDVTGFGLFLDDGTLFAVHSSAADPILSKAELAAALFAMDIAFTNNIATWISFGNALFLYPPATETVRGTARIATQARVDALVDGADDAETIVTPKTLRQRLGAFFTAVTDALNAFAARTITGTGAATGGGDLTANREINVAIATAAEIRAASAASPDKKVVTIRELGSLAQQLGATGYKVLPGGLWIAWGHTFVAQPGTATVTLPLAFPTSVRAVTTQQENERNNGDDNDESIVVDPAFFTATGFRIDCPIRDGNSGNIQWIAFGD